MIKLGLLRRRECCVLTARGWLLIAVLVLGSGAVLVRSANPFLSANRPLRAEVLVVESWLPDFALASAAQEFRRGAYRCVVTTGGNLPDAGLLSRYRTGAEFAAARLQELGLDPGTIMSAPGTGVARDRTFASAQALKQWLRQARPEVRAVNVYSLGPHARRSRLLFQRALGAGVEVGIIACPDATYDGNQWWASSEGLRAVLSEAAAYLYACAFVHG